MSTRQEEIQVKLEGNELQSYLETFNKEIEGNDSQAAAENEDEEEVLSGEEEDGDQYFVDSSGNYYFQGKNDKVPRLTKNPNLVQDDDEPETNEGQEESAEVSYVFIMDENEEKIEEEDEEGQKVYEFEDGQEEQSIFGGPEDRHVPKKVVRTVSKKAGGSNQNQVHFCTYCNYSSPKRYLLSRHMKSHSEERPFKCQVCERGFKTQASLQNHTNTHTGTKPHSCKYCSSSFTTSGELVRHVRYRHTHEKPHKCTECDYASVELSKLKRHIRCHTGERPYQCPHCTYASPDTFKLKRHLRIHTGEKPYECDVCHARFTQSNSLKAHKLIHSVGDKPVFNCELCPTTCGRKTDLRIHVQKLHTADKPLKCKRCGNLFPDRYSYKLHSKTHEGEKCYKCELCPYASISARHLESHMLIHTDQKPFNCDLCEQSFRQKQLLKRHVNLYHNPDYVPPKPKEKNHKCPNSLCTRSFRHKGNLIRHMALHDPDSSIREEAIALKMGRRKRIQIIDGQQVEIYQSNDDSEEEEEEDEDDEQEEYLDEVKPKMEIEGKRKEMYVNVGDNGQQYVVLEVLEMGDGDEDGRPKQEVVYEEEEEIEQINEEDPMDVDTDFIIGDELTDDLDAMGTSKFREQPHKMLSDDKDMSNCFGFDDDDDDDEMAAADGENDDKRTIRLLDEYVIT
ncbi:hypothetical protein HA402_014113 [Bradysia odoriphaga]|nr:hypothetical protein HA402_014113 [Bradysia odoriphaga]